MTQPSDGHGPPPGYGPPPASGPALQPGRPFPPGRSFRPGQPYPGYAPQPGYRPPPLPAVGPAGQPLAGFGERLAAYLMAVEMMVRSGQTAGKRVMKLRVVPLDPAATLSRATAAKRYFVQFAGGMLVPILPYLDGLWQLRDKPFQQCLHDEAADTIVIKVHR